MLIRIHDQSALMPRFPSNVQSPTLAITFAENDKNLFFLYPSPPGLEPVADTIVAGQVTLELPTARKVKSVMVDLVGRQEFRFKGKERCEETLRQTFTLEIEESTLPAGCHRFAFSIPVPPNSPPSICDFGKSQYQLFARVPGLGRFGKELETSRYLVLFVNHSGKRDGLPPAMYSASQLNHPRMGPTLIELSSKFCMIGSLMRWYITFTDFTLPFRINEITVELVQRFAIRPTLDESGPQEVHQTCQKLYSSSVDPTWSAQLRRVIRPGDDLPYITRQIRLPYDEDYSVDQGPGLTPSHHPDSLSHIAATTEFVFTLVYEAYEGGLSPSQEQLRRPTLQELQVRTKAVLSSCYCRLEYYSLPAYEPKGDYDLVKHLNTPLPKGLFGYPACMCKKNLDDREMQEYGVSREEVANRWRAEEESRAWLERYREKKDGT